MPKLSNPGLTLAMGSLSARFILTRAYAAYLPARYVKRYIDEKQLHLVPDAPTYAYPAWSVWRDDLDDDLATVARATLQTVIDLAEDDTAEVLEQI